MSATGASPSYYDFDAFQEMTINTGGVDVTQQTGGVGINLVTKSGTRQVPRLGPRTTSPTTASSRTTSATPTAQQGATSGNPIQNIKDYGVEAGGPIKKGRAWVWGSYGKQDVNVGVINFYKPTPECQAIKAARSRSPRRSRTSTTASTPTTTLLQTTNLKGEVQLFKGNKLSPLQQLRARRSATRAAPSDIHPIETTRGRPRCRRTYGKHWWNTGPNPTYKFGDQWVISDRLLVDVQYAHVGNNFVLDFHDRRPGRRAAAPHRREQPERPLRRRRACSSVR